MHSHSKNVKKSITSCLFLGGRQLTFRPKRTFLMPGMFQLFAFILTLLPLLSRAKEKRNLKKLGCDMGVEIALRPVSVQF